MNTYTCGTYFAKYDTLSYGKQTVQLNQHVVFVTLVLAIHVELFDALYGQFFLPEADLVRLGSEFVGEVSYVVGKCCGKEYNLTITGKLTGRYHNELEPVPHK